MKKDELRPRASEDASPAAERETDLLVSIASRAAAAAVDPDDARHAPFFDWMAREARESRSAAERAAARAGAAAFAREMLARVALSRLPVRRVESSPSLRRAALTGRAGEVLGAAEGAGCAPYIDLAVAAGVGRELWDEECDLWVELPRDMGSGHHLSLKVAGDSMTPLLHGGDVVLVKLGEEPVPGAVVVARAPDGYVVKCVGKVSASCVELCSLNPTFRPITVRRRKDTILGAVVLRWCAHERAAPPAA